VGEHRDRLRTADGVDLVDAEQRRAARIVGCGRPPKSCCGGEAMASEATPASCAARRS
jgi:hypothetical protein